MISMSYSGTSSGTTTSCDYDYGIWGGSATKIISAYDKVVWKKLTQHRCYDDTSWANCDITWTAANSSTSDVKFFNCTDSGWMTYSCSGWKFSNRKLDPLERLKDIMQKRHAPGIIIVDSKRPMSSDVDIREQRARETLARLVGQERYFKFLKSGFVSAHNRRSGKIYQIFPGNGITKVFQNGNLVARLCVVFNKDFPPTDSIIMRYLLALNDEQKLWDLAIKHSIEGYNKKSTLVQADIRPLTDILKELKKVA